MSDGTYLNWVSMPSKSDEAMALMAFATDKSVRVFWSGSDVAACANGWTQNRPLEGAFIIDRSIVDASGSVRPINKQEREKLDC